MKSLPRRFVHASSLALSIALLGAVACSSTQPHATPSASKADVGGSPSATDVSPKTNFSTPAVAGNSSTGADVAMRSLGDAFFDFDQWTLKETARTSLASDAEWMKQHPQVRIVIEGHCDERGTRDYNLALGEKRAQVAAEYLEAIGVDAKRISIISYGKERPFSSGHDEAAWSANRRAHFVQASK